MTREPDDGRFTDEYFRNVGVAAAKIDRAMQGYRSLAVDIIGLSVRAPVTESGEYLATVRGIDSEGARVVAFHNAASFAELIVGIEARLSSGTFKWRPDNWVK